MASRKRTLGIVFGGIVALIFAGIGYVQLSRRGIFPDTLLEIPKMLTVGSDKAKSSDPKSEKVLSEWSDLAPEIGLIGENGTVPEGIRIQFSRPITHNPNQSVEDKTVISIEPPVAGELSYESVSVLRFVPERPFAYQTTFKTTLKNLAINGHNIPIPSDSFVTRSFTTPKFDVLRANLTSIDENQRTVQATIVFTGAIDVASISQHVRLKSSVGDVSLTLRPGSKANEAIAEFPLGAFSETSGVTITLAARLADAAKSADLGHEASFNLLLPTGAEVEIKKIKLQEGPNGYYLTVVCDDHKRRGNDEKSHRHKIYYYDSDGDITGYISDRCQFEESSMRSRLRFIPEVKWTLAPMRGGFKILGDFKVGNLQMSLDGGVRSIDSGVLKLPVVQNFLVPMRSPAVGFAAQGRYLPRSGWKSLGIRHRNVSEVEIQGRVIAPQNLSFWLSAKDETADDRLSDLVFTKNVAVSSPTDRWETTWLDLKTLAAKPPEGIIELSIRDLPHHRSIDRKRLILTDINLIAKRSRSGKTLSVWALDTHSNSPISGVNLKLIVRSGRTVAECDTGDDGGCQLFYDKGQVLEPAEPMAIIGRKADDLTYLRFSDLKTEVSETIVQGLPYADGAVAYRAAIWSDRGAYRPGETAHIGAVVRGGDHQAPEAGMPVELIMFDPREKLVRKLVLSLNDAGFVSADLKLEAFVNTGRYRVALVAAGKELARYSFNVEDFVPERLKVEVAADQQQLLTSDTTKVNINARYLFGGSAEGSRVELQCEMLPGDFKPSENANYQYGVWYPDTKEQPKPLALGSISGTLDEKGMIQLACPTPSETGGFAGAAKLRARGIVFEGESGRSSQNFVDLPVHPDHFYIGLESATKKVESGQKLKFQGVLVDWQGKILEGQTLADLLGENDGKIDIELVRLESEWDWSYDEGEGDSNFRRYLRPASESITQLPLSGGRFKGEFNIARDAASYIVRARLRNARTDLSVKGGDEDMWWYPAETSRDQTPKPFKPQWIDLVDIGNTAVGEELVVKFDAPYKGRLLLTTETDEVLTSEWRVVDAGPVERRFSVKKFYPNIYVTALLIKDPHLESSASFMPDRAFGVRSYRIDPKDFRHEVRLSAPKEMQSNRNLTVAVEVKSKTEGEVYATVAAVDEGILSLTRFKSPDPIKQLFESRALGVETFETIGWNVLLPGGGTASTTGGDAADDQRSVQLIKPVAIWSGLIKLNNGKAKIDLAVPQYRGELRVMAVTFDKQHTGTATAQVSVRDPLVLQTTLPRFLTDGDDVTIPVAVTNMSGNLQKIRVSLRVVGVSNQNEELSDTVNIQGKTEHNLPLEPGKSETVVFRGVTLATAGGAKFAIKAEADGLESHEELEVPIVSAMPLSREIKRRPLTDGETDLKPFLSGWTKGTEHTMIRVTANPYLDTFAHLRHLIQYPHGCIEQTTSATRPLLVLRNMLHDLEPNLLPQEANVDEMAQKGIERVLSMQTSSGGFGYWPGDDHPTYWGTAYATHMLLDAMALNFPIPKERVDEAVRWLDEQIVNTFRYLPANTQNNDNFQDLKSSVAYMHYVLARAGKSYKADVEKLIASAQNASAYQREQTYLLKAALWLAGDRRYEGDLKNLDVSPLTEIRLNDWTYFSDLRYRGLMLSTFTDLFKADPAGEKLADLVAAGLRKQTSASYSTQELIWSITGLGKRIAGSASPLSATLLVNGKPRQGIKGDFGPSWKFTHASELNQLAVRVDGGSQLFAIISSQGVKDPPDFTVGGNGLEVTRSWYKPDGVKMNPETDVKLGEIIFTELTLRNTTQETIRNIALVDRFPAAFEVENPRLGRSTAANFIDKDSLWDVSYLNIRDDRLEAFGSLKPQEKKSVWYAVRAVVSGRFNIPPVEAEAMYDPQLWARAIGGKTNVKGPWEEFAGQ